MKRAKTSVLLVEDDTAMAAMVAEGLVHRGFDVHYVRAAEDAVALIKAERFRVVVADVRLGQGMSGLELCQHIHAHGPEVPVILITAFGDLELAIAALRAGAWDFMAKPLSIEALAVRAGWAAGQGSQHREHLRSNDGPPCEMVGSSVAMQRVYATLELAAASNSAVLVTGERGTGKELAARALHRWGSRPERPFVVVDCHVRAGLDLEEELFGRARDTLKDGHVARRGLLREAHGGTLFVDDVAELPLELQGKLLRALEENRLRPVGGDRELAFAARVVCASRSDLRARVARSGVC